jgi:hygromycin-B 7''-O-kinase
MTTPSLNQTLAKIHTNEDYEKLKAQVENDLVKAVIHKHQLPEATLSLFDEGTNIVFSYGDDKVIKIFPPFHQHQFDSDRLVLKHVEGKLSVETPSLLHEGTIFGWPYLIISKLEGRLLEGLWETLSHHNKQGILQELGALIREVHALPTAGLEALDCDWPQFIEKQKANCVANHRTKGLPTILVQQIPAYLDAVNRGIYPDEFSSETSRWCLAYLWFD